MRNDPTAPHAGFDWNAAHSRLARTAVRLEEIENPSAADLERIFRERSLKYAEARSARVESEYLDVITFGIGDSRFAIQATACHVVASITELTPLPGVPSFYLGLFNHRGTIFPIIDVRPLLDGKRREAGTGIARYAVLVAHDQFSIGFAASEIWGMMKFPLDQIASSATTESGSHAIFGIGPNATVVIDADQLLRDARLVVDEMPIIASGNEGGRR